MLLKRKTIAIVLFLSFYAKAQYPNNPIKPTPTKDRIAAVEQRKQLKESSLFTGIEAISIGPTIMSGRVVDVAVNPENSIHFFVAYATGGVWETKNNGQSFAPIFDDNGYTIHCGAIAVDWTSKIIYVGTGEANSSRSSYAGYGIFSHSFLSDTVIWNQWQHLGLIASQHISKIVVHPTKTNTLYVAAMGNLFSPNPERGVYKSTNGGKNWRKILYVDPNTSAVDLEISQTNPNLLIAAMWQKGRRAWNFWESGTNSGIYTTSDEGESWVRSASFPQGEHIGRIGLSTTHNNTCYALLDNQERYKKQKEKNPELSKKSFETMSVDSFLQISDSSFNQFLKKHRFPKNYTAKSLHRLAKKGGIKPIDIYHYLHDGNAALFEDPIKGAELYASTDFGKTWQKTHDHILEKVCYSYGYYFGLVHANPVKDNHVIIAGVPLLQSIDGGKTFTFIGGDNVHVDHHFVWINPKNAKHLINGNDGGINISYDGGKNWTKCNSPAVGQFYTVAVDNQKNYNVYGGLQDNGVWKGPNNYTYSTQWHQEGKYPYERLMGGDGMQIQIDPRDHSVYTGYQFGHYFHKKADGKNRYLHPMHHLKEDNLRWNWQTPILLSSHNSDILYMGSNKLHRSMKKGEKFVAISSDLTHGKKEGDTNYGTLTTISESPLKFGYIYTGSDDGLIHITKDGGESWEQISKKLPPHYWIRKVVASRHKKERVYAVLNGHTWNNDEALCYVSNDYGTTWKKIGNNLPNESINVICEDARYQNIVYLGTHAGVYVSTNYGVNFSVLANMPPVAVHDMVVQKEHSDLVIGTHGRSLYKINISPVYKSLTYKDSGFVLLDIKVLNENNNWGKLSYDWKLKKPNAFIEYFSDQTNLVELSISDSSGNLLAIKSLQSVLGYNKVAIPLVFDSNPSGKLKKGNMGKYYPVKGRYTITLTSNNKTQIKTLIVQ